MVADNAMMAAADRSIPPAMITTVIPSAATPTSAVLWTISRRLGTVANRPSTPRDCARYSSAPQNRQNTSTSHTSGPAITVNRRMASFVPPGGSDITSHRAAENRFLVPFCRRPHILQPSAAHDGDAVADGQQLGEV